MKQIIRRTAATALHTVVCCLPMLAAGKLQAQTAVPLGGGSYASEVPASEHFTDAYFGLPAAQVEPLTATPSLFGSLHIDPALAGKPIPTNQWWTDLLAANRSYLQAGTEQHVMQQDPYGGNMWFYPGMLAPRSYGLDLYFPNAWKPANADGSPQGGFEKGTALQIRGDRGFSNPAEDVLIADFEGTSYPAGWTVTTISPSPSAFPGSPAQIGWTGQNPTPAGYVDSGYINTYLTASGSGGDNRKGILTSPSFTIQKNFIHLLVGGGNDPVNLVVRLKVAGTVVASSTGSQSSTLAWNSWDVSAYRNQNATLEIVDTSSGGWGFILCDEIVQSDAASPVGRYGRDMIATSSVVTNWGDWNVDFKLPDASGNVIDVAMARGIPFTWTRWTGGVKPRLLHGGVTLYGTDNAPINTGSGSFTASAFSFTYQGKCFGVFLPDATVVNVTGSEVRPQLGGANNYMVVGYLPGTASLASYAALAYAKPTDTQISWTHDPAQGLVNTTWNITTTPLKGSNLDTIQGWLPHHYRTTSHSLAFTGATYLTPRGIMKCATGRSFQIAFPFKGISPVLPAPVVSAVANPYQPSRMLNYLKKFNPGTMIGDTYWSGKALALCADFMARSHQTGDTADHNRLKGALKTALTNWLTYTPGETQGFFAPYPNWHAFIGSDASYGSQAFNDLHFHYGYFAVAGAILGMYDTQFITDYGPMLRAIVKCYGNWDRTDASEPFLRTFDIWEGHSNAGGLSGGNGNNQESSSEATQSWAGMFLLGNVMGDAGMAAAGAMGFSMETCAVNEYWQDIHQENFPAGYNRAGNGILGADSYAYGTYFSGDPAWVYAIQYSPAHHWNNYMTRYQPATVAAKYQAMWTERLNWCRARPLWDTATAYTQGTWVQWNDHIYSAQTAIAAGGIEPGKTGALWNHEADCSKSETDVLGDSPGHVVMSYQTLWDHDNSAAQFDNYITANSAIANENGQGGATYYLIHALRTLGDQDFAYTTSLPTSSVYLNSSTGVRTYLVYNPMATTQSVTVYHNGTPSGTMTVPAHVTVATQDPNYSAAAPPVPAGATSSTTMDQAILSWTGSTTAARYVVNRAPAPGGPYVTLATVESPGYTDTGLSANQTYYYTFSAANSVGASTDSAPLSVTTVPAPPTGLAVSLANGHPVLTWDAAVGITSYKVKRSNTLNGTYAIVGTPATNTFNDSTTVAGTMYYYTVTAVNAGGDSVASAAVSVSTITPPATPANFNAALGNGLITLAWTAATGNPTGYEVRRSTTPGGPYAVIGTTASTSFNDTAVATGLTYYYVIAATNAGGASAPTAEAGATVLPSPVMAVNCGGAAAGQFAADGNFTGGTQSTTTNPIDTTGLVNPAPQAVYKSNRYGNNTTYTLGGLTPGGTYNVRLHFSENYQDAAGKRTFNIKINGTQVATNFDIFAEAGGKFKGVIREFGAAANPSGQLVIVFVTVKDNAQCNGIEIREPRPVAPTNAVATGGPASILLSWTAAASATSYLVKRSNVPAGPFTILASVATTQYTDPGLATGVPQYYLVTAVNSGGESPESNIASATPATTYSSFQQQYFTAGQLADPLVSGPAADANGDGVQNLLAYAFAVSPWDSCIPNLPTAQLVDSHLTITFIRRKSSGDLTYLVETSGDMQTWNSGPDFTTQVSVTSRDSETETVVVRDNVSKADDDSRFVRVKVVY